VSLLHLLRYGARYRDERVCMSVCMSARLSVCLSARRPRKPRVQTSRFVKFGHVNHEIFCARYGRSALWRHCNTLCISGLVDDVMSVHYRSGKGDTIRAYTQSDSPGGSRPNL